MGPIGWCTGRTSVGYPHSLDRTRSAARRRHPRRQPSVGPGCGDDDRRRPPGRRRQDPATCSAGATRSASRSSRCGCSPPTTSSRPSRRARPAAADHRGDRRPTSRRATAGRSTRSVPSTCCPTTTDAVAQGGRRRHRRRRRAAPSTSPSATAGAARSPTPSARCCRSTPTRGTSLDELAEVARRRPHRRAPLHPRPARPRPGDPHQSGEQRLVGLPAVAERALGVLLLRGVLAGLPQDRLPARPARLRRPRPPLRRLTLGVPPARRPRAADGVPRESPVRWGEAHMRRRAVPTVGLHARAGQARRRAEARSRAACEEGRDPVRRAQARVRASQSLPVPPRDAPHVRPRHQRPALRPARAAAVRRARGRPARSS